ncbi:MAG: GNAT family N-acetyltransferase [Chloroflexi bacterium]|nr:GNAT family N-acetyltransferase [Chloroflexota bacterium]
MEFIIHKTDMQNAPKANIFSRKFFVKSRVVLDMENEKLKYSVTDVKPYERDIPAEDVNYGFSDEGPTIFFAEADGKPAGRIKMLKWWNQFAYVDDIVVNPDYRGLGIGRALLEHGIQWARENNFPGVMLETQDDNVPACALYQKHGFVLSGFDRNVYKAVHLHKDETALYWYLIF